MKRPRPPYVARIFLQWILGSDVVARTILGDLEEEFGQRLASGRNARGWYVREAADIGVRTLVRRVRGLGGWERPPVGGGPIGGGDGRMRRLAEDVAQTIRTLVRAPGFAAVVILTLALAVGASATVFSVVKTVLLDPLPFPEADRLVVFRSQAPGLPTPPDFGVAPEFELQYEEADAIANLGLYQTLQASLRLGDVTERLPMARVSHGLFGILDVTPILGRIPDEDDLEVAFQETSLVLSHGTWTTRFGRDPGVVGRIVDVGGRPHEIVAVMGPDLRFPTEETAAWLPLRVDPERLQPGAFTWELVGRMRDGVEIRDVQAQVTPLAERLADDYAGFPRYVSFLRQGRYQPLVRSLRDHLVGDLAEPLWILLGTVGFVFLIACTNVANLFMVRGESRHREMAVRAAMGAGRGRLIRERMTEAGVLASAGGILGIGLAWVGAPILFDLAPNGVPRLGEAGLDGGVVAFTVLLSITAAILFGLVPAIRASAPSRLRSLRDAGRGAAAGRQPAVGRSLLVITQTAMALMLLVGSGLLVDSLRQLRDADPGFSADGVLTLRYALPQDRYTTPAEAARFHTRLRETLKGLPGVVEVGMVLDLPVAQPAPATAFAIEGQAVAEGELESMLSVTFTSPGYFEAMGIELRAGRAFENADHEGPTGAVVVSEGLARRIWPGEDAVGRRLRLAADTASWSTVVGVVADVRQEGLRESAPDMVYNPMVTLRGDAGQVVRAPTVVVRGQRPEQLVQVIRERVRGLDPSVPVYGVQTMDQVMETSLVRLTFTLLTLALSATFALLLGTMGVYGVISYLVTQRTQEIGVRLALGAAPGSVRWMVLRQGLGLAGVGSLVGLVGAAALSRVLAGLLYGTPPLDPGIFALMTSLMLLAAAAASYLPARRASTVDPLASMRS